MWRVRGRRRHRLVRLAIALMVLVGVGALLAIWPSPPVWLAAFRHAVGQASRWVVANVFTLPLVSLIVALVSAAVAVIVPIAVAVRQRDWGRHDRAEERRITRDRKLMLRRVHNKWVRDVYLLSLADSIEMNVFFVPWDSSTSAAGHVRPRPIDTELSVAFQETAGALLIVGAPGSGKTTALLGLANDLIKKAAADSDQPLPVVFLLSSWSTRQLSIDDWLVDELNRSYDVPRRTATEWIRGNLVLPLLDGLDEVGEAYRATCVKAINDFRRAHGLTQFVVCSRTEDYTVLQSRLQMEAVELQPLTRRQISGYLGRKSLAGVRAAVRADSLLNELLLAPLVLKILVHTYEAGTTALPTGAGTAQQRLENLFEMYVQQMLRHRTGRYTAEEKVRWLSWLAGSMRDKHQTEFHLDRLRPDWLPARAQRIATVATAITAGLLAGLADGVIYSLVHGLSSGLVNGIAIGLFFTLFAGLGRRGSVYYSRGFAVSGRVNPVGDGSARS